MQQTTNGRKRFFVELLRVCRARQTDVAPLDTRINRVCGRARVLREREDRGLMFARGPRIRKVDANALRAATSKSGDHQCDSHWTGYAATTSSITSAPAGNDAAANAVRAGSGVIPNPGSHAA